MISRYCGLLIICLGFCAQAQVTLRPFSPQILIGGRQLAYPFAGGLNSGQFQSMDIDDDGDQDLIVFDRASETIVGFENLGDQYQFNPDYAHYFPSGLIHWMQLADYNCDGRKDLFTHSNLGIQVFQNTEGSPIEWVEVASPLFSRGESGDINMLFNSSDISSITDLDSDGDLDMLYFNFANGDFMELHKNFSVERTGQCGLDFERVAQEYGSLEMCACDDFSFGEESCHENQRIQHFLGKSILSMDHNGDGLQDLIIGQESCENLSLLLNEGTTENAEFTSFDINFPNVDESLNWREFPAAYQLDVDFDGEDDLIIAQNVRDDATGQIDFSQSTRVYRDGHSETFLQHEMIDVGEAAFPAFMDIDGDGLDDLVIGSRNAINSEMPPALHYYRQENGGFELVTNDLFGLRALGWTQLVPQFVDVNDDQKKDLVIASQTGFGERSFMYWLNEGERGMDIDVSSRVELDITLSRTDDFQLYDWDHDGLLDLLVGNVFGELIYYRNEGPDFNFVLEDQDLLDSENASDNLNLSLAIGDADEDGIDDLLTSRRNGALSLFTEVQGMVIEPFMTTLQNGDVLPTRLGRRSKPAIGRLNGQAVIAVGKQGGGIRMFAVEINDPDAKLTLDIFPNPAPSGIYSFRSNQQGGTIQILDMAGNQLSNQIVLEDRVARLDLTSLEAGIYLARLRVGGKVVTNRLVIP